MHSSTVLSLLSSPLFHVWLWEHHEIKSWEILEILAVAREKLDTVLYSLTSKPQILNTEVMSAASSFEVGSKACGSQKLIATAA